MVRDCVRVFFSIRVLKALVVSRQIRTVILKHSRMFTELKHNTKANYIKTNLKKCIRYMCTVPWRKKKKRSKTTIANFTNRANSFSPSYTEISPSILPLTAQVTLATFCIQYGQQVGLRGSLATEISAVFKVGKVFTFHSHTTYIKLEATLVQGGKRQTEKSHQRQKDHFYNG